jgi:hypothetical protein
LNLNDRYVIETTRELVNPTKDGRNKRDWNKLPTIPAGSRFIVHVMSLAWMIDGKTASGTATRDTDETPSREESRQSYAFELISSELAKLILSNARCVKPESMKELAELNNDSSDKILHILIKLGRVKAGDFAAVAKAVEADENL